MVSRLQILRQDDFTGGLNLRADQFQLAPNETPRMLNMEIDPRGGLFSRGAMRRINAAPITTNWRPENLVPFYGKGSAHYLFASTSSLGASNGSVYWSTGSSFTDSAIPVSSEFGASFAPWGESVYVATGLTTPSYVWNGNTSQQSLTAAGTAWQNDYQNPSTTTKYFPQAQNVVTHAGKVFAASVREGGVNYPNRIRWSHPNNPTNWAFNDYIDINDGGSDITAIAIHSGQLIVFKANAVFAILGYDSDTFQVVDISRTVGALSPRAVVSTEQGVYFFSYPDGLMLWDGQKIMDLFEPIRPAIILKQIDPSSIFKTQVNYVHKRVWVSVAYSETATLSYLSASFIFDPTIGEEGTWLMFQTADGKGASGGTSFIQGDGNIIHAIAHPTVADVLSVDLYTQTTDNINASELAFTTRYRTKWQDAGQYSQKKMFRRPDIVAKQSATATAVNVSVYRDYEEAAGSEFKNFSLNMPQSGSAMIWGVSTWNNASWGTAGVGAQVINGNNIGLARSIQLEFSGPGGKSWGLDSYSLKYVPRRIKA